MRSLRFILSLGMCTFCIWALHSTPYAHTINYDVQQKGIAVRIFYAAEDPASYSQYEVYGPGDTLPHQTGRTDKNGFVAFVPERPGIWKIKVLGESSHGFHGVTVEADVNETLDLKSFSKPLAATYTKLLIGVSLVFGIFGLYSLFRARKRGQKEECMRNILRAVIVLVFILPSAARAHHGAVGLAFGPGSPIETASPLSLPQGGFVVSNKLEYVPFRKFDFAEPANKDSFTFYNLSLAYGITPCLTAGIVFPYSIKRQDTLGTNHGLGDIGLNGLLGFNYDPVKGFRLNAAEDTAVALDSVRKIFFSLNGGITFPTGRSHMELGGQIERDMQPGFRSPSFTLGVAAQRQMTRSLGLVAETSYQIFTQKDRFKFGNEWRSNLAGVYELYGKAGNFLQTVNGILELNLLHIARDTEDGEKARASGGTILYLSPGLRFSFPKIQNANLGVLFKFPVLKSLNEKDEQQGSEGLEKFRAIATLSFFF